MLCAPGLFVCRFIIGMESLICQSARSDGVRRRDNDGSLVTSITLQDREGIVLLWPRRALRCQYFFSEEKHMRYLVLFACALSILISGCKKYSTEKRGDDSVAAVSSDDAEMNKIIEDARKTSKNFYRILNAKKNNQRDFSVKYPFQVDGGDSADVEHIWLSNLTMENNTYYGIVSNDPFYVKGMKIGDKVRYDPEKISDWKYIENGCLVGGKSIIFFLKNLSSEEKKEILSQMDYKIKDFE
jgi:uncharacterized protein YegJ (DUF2314 family)